MVQRPEDKVTVLGKRVTDDPLDLLWDKYFQSISQKPKKLSATPAAPSEPHHGSTDVVHAPAPDAGPSTVNPEHGLVESSSPLPAAPPVHEGKQVEDSLDSLWEHFENIWGKPKSPSATPASLSPSPSELNHGSTDVVHAPAPDAGPSTVNPEHGLVEPSSPLPVAPPVHEGKQVGDPLDAMWEKYFQNKWPKSPSATPASLNPAPSNPDSGSTNFVQGPAPDAGPSTVNPDHGLVKPSSPSPAVPPVHEGKQVEDPLDAMWEKYFKSMWGDPKKPSATPASLSPAPSEHNHGSTDVVQPASSEIVSDHGLTEEPHMPQPTSSTDLNFDNPEPSGPVGQSNPRLTTILDSHPDLMRALQSPPPLKFSSAAKTESREDAPDERVRGSPTS